jgi:hypothetical protein
VRAWSDGKDLAERAYKKTLKQKKI